MKMDILEVNDQISKLNVMISLLRVELALADEYFIGLQKVENSTQIYEHKKKLRSLYNTMYDERYVLQLEARKLNHQR